MSHPADEEQDFLNRADGLIFSFSLSDLASFKTIEAIVQKTTVYGGGSLVIPRCMLGIKIDNNRDPF